jgi:hypothetical protein
MRDRNGLLGEHTILFRSTMADGVRHAFDNGAIDVTLASEVEKSGKSTHFCYH